jgi:hypothetical protein
MPSFLFRAGMLKHASTHEVEICWEPPKGDFTKYVLSGRIIFKLDQWQGILYEKNRG